MDELSFKAKRGPIITEFIDEGISPIAESSGDAQISQADQREPQEECDPEFEPVRDNSNFRSLDPRSVLLDRIGSFIFVAVLAVGATIATVVSLTLLFWIGIWWIAIPFTGLIVVAFFAWMAYYWPKLVFRHTQWRLVETGLEIHRGVLFKHQLSVPAARVQHVDVSQGPLQRKFELGTLIVHTAGTANASVTLVGLAFDTAKQVRDELVRQRESLDVT